MRTNISKSVKHSLLIEADELGSLVEFIRSKYEKIKITAECKDNSELETEDIADIVNFDNPNYRKIKEITISAHTSYEESLRLRLNSVANYPVFATSARLNITSLSDENAVYLAQEIPKRLREMKPGYDLLARFPLSFLMWLSVSAWVLFRGMGKFFGLINLEAQSPPSNISWNDLFLVLFTLAVLLVSLFAIIDRIQAALFPMVFFSIGKQKRTMESLKNWRMVALTAVILGVVSSLAASYIFQWLQPK